GARALVLHPRTPRRPPEREPGPGADPLPPGGRGSATRDFVSGRVGGRACRVGDTPERRAAAGGAGAADFTDTGARSPRRAATERRDGGGALRPCGVDGRLASLGDSVERRVQVGARLEALAGPVAGSVVLDLGCGRQALWTRAYVARGARVVGIELDPARCREAASALTAAPPAGSGVVLGIVRGDGEHIPLATGTARF